MTIAPPLPSAAPTPRRTAARAVAATVGLLVVLAVGLPAEAAQDPQRERERVQRERAAAAADVDALRATGLQVQEMLETLQVNVANQEALLAEATAAAVAAEQAAVAARQRAEAAQVVRAQAHDTLRATVVEVYVFAGLDADILATLPQDPTAAATRKAIAGFRTQNLQDALDRFQRAERKATTERAAADEAALNAGKARDAAVEQVAAAQAARDQQLTFAADVRRRLDSRLAEAAGLAALDQQLATQIAEQEAELARQLAATSNDESEVSSSSGHGAPPVTTRTPTTSRPIPPPPNVKLRTVRGITVNEDIADEVEAMLAAAEQAGLVYTGSGYRSNGQQVALRQAHCGPTPYDIYEKPPDQCVPPTARPGMSMHERGLAIDFAINGHVIVDEADPGFVWLAANAGQYGFKNLKGEPWHWSTTGG